MSEQLPNQLHQELHAHANALRGLARDLLRDTHAAEDVTQQTLAKAWSVRDRLQTGPVGGWLHRTLTNFARQWRRGERRRTTHEARHSAAFATQSQPSPALTLARREALQSVTNAVLQLDEPYQTAVFLRYFEDLSPRQIAQRTNSNVATVKSRLARGLVMLRARLAQTQGEHDWRLALAGTLGLPLGGALLPLTTGFLLMKTSLKCTLAAAALCIGGFYLYQGEDPTPPTTAPVTNKTVTALNASRAARLLPICYDYPVQISDRGRSAQNFVRSSFRKRSRDHRQKALARLSSHPLWSYRQAASAMLPLEQTIQIFAIAAFDERFRHAL